ncbi:MarR family winged helix-turn-helix transcriptional regulator [Marivita hallyeonensis]|uniref:DNA-binding transcriptional regulator, MarR family n=1 Tax=Marivita hallyeonensis TaxID=996342 RepID=A0A1M5LMW6_9RHOB|nr:MarR family winged helix-turn-helix transcriptional regulator [Marivita hallyeonensis]SHG66250.1 DNA-binding transcriptional regulator, MarR family [Marivita hallyeonensis]
MSPKDFDLTQFLPYRLAVLSERVSKALSTVYTDPYDLTVSDWRVLVHTANEGAVSVREIHRTVNLEKPRVSRSVSRLVALGHLEKVTDRADKRLVKISLTAQGRAILDDILPKALAFEDSLTSVVSKEELAQVLAIAERLHARLDEMRADPDQRPMA